MPEFKLKNGEKIEALLIDREDENYIYLQHVTKTNLDGSTTYYYRYWVKKDEVESEDMIETSTVKTEGQTVETDVKTEERAAAAVGVGGLAAETETVAGAEAMAPRRRRKQ